MSIYLMCIHQVKRKVMNQKTVCVKLKQLVEHFPTYHIKIILGDFNAKVGRRNNPKSTIWKDSIHQESKVNVLRIVKFTASKNVFVMAVHVVRMREGKGVYIALVGKLK